MLIRHYFLLFAFFIFFIFAGCLSPANGAGLSASDRTARSNLPEDIWDPAKYISLEEIEPGMEAYCLTEYGLAGIEKFGLEVVDVVRDIGPGRDAIFVKGTDERFIHTGPVAGCSGSPVYIDGRLAGALAFTWAYTRDPLYGVTPIGEMLHIGLGTRTGHSQSAYDRTALVFDFTRPIDLNEIDRQFRISLAKAGRDLRGANYLPCPLITSGLPVGIREQLSDMVEPFGFKVVAGGGSGNGVLGGGEKIQLVPGSCLAVPLVTGDITMGTYGTVTDVVGDKVYGFGHFLLGYGQIDLPMATAKVHTVVSNVVSSFKLASVVETVGALKTDEAAGVIGQIGAKAKTIPLTVRIDRYNDTEKRIYRCQLAHNRLLTPLYLSTVVSGAALYLGDLPPDHTMEYKVVIDIEDGRSVAFENVSSGLGLNEIMAESISSMALLMNNPYERVDIKAVDFDIRLTPKSIVSHIWSADLSDSKVKAGDSIGLGVIIESVLAGKKRYQCDLKIPKDLAPGKYELTLCGRRDYELFLVKAIPHRFIAQSLPQLINALNDALQISRDKLYCLLVLPPGGVTVEKAELPDLPATRALVLQDSKRTLKVQPYLHWLERNIETDTVVIDKKVMQITVEK